MTWNEKESSNIQTLENFFAAPTFEGLLGVYFSKKNL